jgi:Tc toxin complex TcA C-terminal TcB-binding domain
MADFPENDVEILREYFPASTADAPPLSALVDRIVAGLQAATVPVKVQDDPAKNGPAHSISEARRTLRSFLTDPVVASVRKALRAEAEEDPAGVYDRIVRQHEFDIALKDIDKLVPHAGTKAIAGGVLSLALRPTPVQFTEIEEIDVDPNPDAPGGHIIKRKVTRTLPGYSGQGMNAAQRASLVEFNQFLRGETEHTFRIAVLKGECHVGKRDYEQAIREYSGILKVSAIGETRRKFLAIRAASAHVALAEISFRRTRQLTPEDEQSILTRLDTAISLLDEHGVSPDNPLRTEIASRVDQQKTKLAGHVNVFGFRDSLVPVQRFTFLEEEAGKRLDQAKGAAAKFEEFLTKANEREDLAAELRAELETAEENVTIATTRVAIAVDGIDRATTQFDILSNEQAFLTPKTVLDGFGSVLASALGPAAAGGPGAVGMSAAVGLTSALVGFAARSTEVGLQARLAELDRDIALKEKTIADHEAAIAGIRRDFVARRQAVTGGRRLSQDLYYALARTNEDLARSHLEAAIRFAYLYERAVAYFLGSPPNFTPVRFDYADDEGDIFSAPALLEKDVSTIRGAFGDPELPKRDRFIEQLSLKESHPIEFSRLLQTGQMDFAISLYELDKRRPGSHQGRLVDVAVEVRGLVPPTGFTGQLTHMGRFLVRDRRSTLDPSTQRLIPTDAQLEEVLARQERGEVSVAAVGGVVAFDLGPDTKELDASTASGETDTSQVFTLEIFEGYGPAGLWRLNLDANILRSITDVMLRFQIEAFESDVFDLAPKVRELISRYEDELAAGDALDRVLAVSLRQVFPDAFFELANGPGRFQLDDNRLPVGITEPRVKAVVTQTLDDNGNGVQGVGLEISKQDTSFNLVKITGPDGFSEDVTAPIPFIEPQARFSPLGAWTLNLSDRSQVSLLGDLRLFFIYEFQET